MRKIITLIALFLTISSFSQEKDATQMMQFFKKEIKISTEQETQLTQVVTNYLNYVTHFEAQKNNNDEGIKLRLNHLKDSYNKKVKAILTEKQYQKYTKLIVKKGFN